MRTKPQTHAPLLSKSRYQAGRQCRRLLWLRCHTPETLGATDAATQFVFDQGHRVGAMAQRCYPDGQTIAWEARFADVLRSSREALADRRPIFEAGFMHGRAYTRADILEPVGKRRWDLIEVKSTTRVKDEHIEDLAFQRHVYQGSGLSIRRSLLMHLDGSYRRQGEIDSDALFTRVDLTREVKRLQPRIEKRIAKLNATLARRTAPQVAIGSHCTSPYACPFFEDCHAFLPEHDVLSLLGGGRKAQRLLSEGVLALRDIQKSDLTPRQALQVRAVKRGKARIDKPALRAFLETLRYPLHLLDFETVSTAIPLYDDTRPWRSVPFQYALQIIEEPGARPRSRSFLAQGKGDPRPRFLATLKRHLGRRGSIVAYNANFERQRLEECAERFPEHARWIRRVKRRLVDLYAPFRALSYYHPEQDGSVSLKAVLPALTGQGYDDLDVADGQHAGRAFLQLVEGEVQGDERAALRKQLKAYCQRDTEGMLWIIERLQELVG